MQKVIIASNNRGKIKEVQDILNQFEIVSLSNLGVNIEIEEDKETFLENAVKKVQEIAKKLDGNWCLADDSGIMIDYLDGFPGVHTKRWMLGSDRERNLEIIKKLKGIPKEKRTIHFVCAVALSNGKITISETAEIVGFVAENPRGSNGFGFDEIFELTDGKTLAELSSEEKNRISARKKAIEKLKNSIEGQNLL